MLREYINISRSIKSERFNLPFISSLYANCLTHPYGQQYFISFWIKLSHMIFCLLLHTRLWVRRWKRCTKISINVILKLNCIKWIVPKKRNAHHCKYFAGSEIWDSERLTKYSRCNCQVEPFYRLTCKGPKLCNRRKSRQSSIMASLLSYTKLSKNL